MFLIDMHFADSSKITPELTQAHRDYLTKEYENGKLLFGGRKNPRTGGIIISRHDSEAELRAVLEADPFIQSGAVSFSLTEFVPVMASAQYAQLLLQS
jgi:uncharacterized protein YciI